MIYWKMRDKTSGMWSLGGIDAKFDETGRTFKNRIGVKGSIFHYVYGFRVVDDGVRRFHPRGIRSVDDYEAVCFDGESGINVVPERDLFTKNQLLNKCDRDLINLNPRELAIENRKQL